MGTTSSKISQKPSKRSNSFKQKALSNYITKIKNYNVSIHGPIEQYMAQVDSEYESEYNSQFSK
jgi:hypothetical protein